MSEILCLMPTLTPDQREVVLIALEEFKARELARGDQLSEVDPDDVSDGLLRGPDYEAAADRAYKNSYDAELIHKMFAGVIGSPKPEVIQNLGIEAPKTEDLYQRRGPHSSHRLRSSDASSFDLICEACGHTDLSGDGWGKLVEPCPVLHARVPGVPGGVVSTPLGLTGSNQGAGGSCVGVASLLGEMSVGSTVPTVGGTVGARLGIVGGASARPRKYTI